METFIERINKLAVDTGENVPKIIGSNLVILEFKDFIKRLLKRNTITHQIDIDDVKELAGCRQLVKSEHKKDCGCFNCSKDVNVKVAKGEKQ